MSRHAGRPALGEQYRAGFQGTKVVGLTLLALACAVGGAWWGLDIAQTWGLREADGGVLKPLWERVALGGGLALLGVVFFAGMLVYLRFYIIGIDVEDEGQTVVIRRCVPFPVRRLPSAHVRISGAVHTGEIELVTIFSPQARGVRAPWVSVHIRGWKWPLLLDLQGRFEN